MNAAQYNIKIDMQLQNLQNSMWEKNITNEDNNITLVHIFTSYTV